VHTRSLLASIDVSLSAGGLATATTLAETRSNDMDFASELEQRTGKSPFFII
jgi:hypothetical protein